jgi:hypothetical protein
VSWTEQYRLFSTLGTQITIGSARRSSCSIESGVSLFGVTIAVSLGVNTRASLKT